MKVKSSRGSDPGTRRPIVPFLLPVRTNLTLLQTVKAWLLQGWQHLRTPRFIVQPPLQPARHKPFPQRPHQQRRQAVFIALDAAPAGLTRRQLIAHVRVITGVGCSENLITQWRQERQRDSATEGRRDTGKKRRGLFGLLFCLSINGCATTTMTPPLPPAEVTISPAPSETPNLVYHPSPLSNSPGPRLLRIKLTINAASDLLVKQDDDVKAGQVLTNRSHERERLLAQRRGMEAQTQQIEAQLTTATESIHLVEKFGAELPPISFASEQAAISKAEALITTRKVEVQKQRLAALPAVVPSNFDKQAVESHETAKLTFVQDSARQANAEVALQKAKLTSAQETRAFQEKQHALELSKQLLTARHQQQQAVIARSQLLTQIAALDLQLAQLAQVHAPFSGKIRRIEYEDRHDQTLTVLVYLAVGN